MFIFAMATGVRQGWLSEKKYRDAAENAWAALVGYLDEDGNLKEVCIGTGALNNKTYYEEISSPIAKKSFESAIQVAARIGDPDPQWRAYGFLGWIAEKEENNQRAFEDYAKAISIIESMRAKFTDPSLKTLFMKDSPASMRG
jgi:tetratricopeptide (TPR) repeat protein